MALCDTIKEHNTDDSKTVDALRKDLKQLCTFKPTREKIVGLLGRSGEGKSSLINSLLGFTDLAPAGDIGTACTSVVTEFRQKDGRHASQITLEVEYYTEAEIEELLADLVGNFRKVELLPKAPSTEDEEALPRNRQHSENQSKEAWSALQAAFGHHELFGRSFLLDQTEGAFDRIVSQLNQWTQLLQWPEEAKDGRYSISVDDEDECAENISLFMQDKFWPFTKIMRIFIDSDILRSGIVLTDLPGRSDTNTARIKAGQMYLTTCDCVFILSNISRAVTDDSLKSSVYELLAQEMPLEWEMNRGERLQVIVICTKTDEINIPANKRAFIPDNSPEFRSCIQELEKEKKQTDDEKKKKSLQTQIKSLLIKARNNNVRSKLRRSYQLENPNSQLNVFCVSSKMYNKSVNKDGADRMLELSGIPLLRLFCRSLNRLDRREEISNFIRSDLRGLLNTVDLLSSTIISQMDGETAAEVWKDAQEKIDYIIISAEDETKEQCLKTLADYFERRTTIWKQAALQQFQKWLSWHWTQFDAFCLHYGDYETKKIKRTNWNRDIIWRMAQELAYPLTEIEEDASGAFDKLLSHVQQEEDDLKETYKEGGLPPALLFGVELHVQSLAFEVRKAQKNLKRELVILCRSFLEANRASYVVQKMMPAYLSASSEFGSGMMRRQQNMMRSQITDELFPAMQTAMEDSLSGLFESTFGDLRNKLQHILHLVRNSVAIGLASSSALQQVRTDTDSFRSGVQQLRAEYEHIADQIGAAQ
ncbi:uncharacterized protein Z520_11977 [Fonsecaea multimorphosa CBS 102226]|uniref:G domain-containing protein n=1 Tax=Fonsecaea multimorphosa CBS 102226 TaxID=1442371 RepID=A0A0D2JPI7_9EURO|nr:uncharacterized protein Z520_11977 [Fonsecaea multimorphosa CBS 102226]KIX92369.1 hypothetical protein Z520_11977 [Fonsecaea multimorphosa CBS 102226]